MAKTDAHRGKAPTGNIVVFKSTHGNETTSYHNHDQGGPPQYCILFIIWILVLGVPCLTGRGFRCYKVTASIPNADLRKYREIITQMRHHYGAFRIFGQRPIAWTSTSTKNEDHNGCYTDLRKTGSSKTGRRTKGHWKTTCRKENDRSGSASTICWTQRRTPSKLVPLQGKACIRSTADALAGVLSLKLGTFKASCA